MGNHKVLKTSGINLRYSMYEFIDAVREHQIIWDREHENFHNRELRDAAWLNIGKQLCKNFEEASAKEKQEISKTLLKRWKNTRDSYLRVHRLRQSGEEISRASYIYEKELSFLLDGKNESLATETENSSPPLKRKSLTILRSSVKRNTTAKSDTEVETQNSYADGIRSVIEGLNYTDDSFPHQESVSNAPTPTPKTEASFAVMDFNTSTNTVNPPAAQQPTDPDQSFFDSIKPYMQKMTTDQKLDFQIEVLKILRNFK